MRLALALIAALAVATPAAAQRYDEGFDDRGYDRNDRTPDWNYRNGESEGKGAYYDGGRYGPRGTGGIGVNRLDPWLSDTPVGGRFVRLMAGRERDGRIHAATVRRANTWFRRYADADRNLRPSDAEITTALMTIDKSAR